MPANLLVPALRAVADSDRDRAVEQARAAAEADPGALLPRALVRYLGADRGGSVYEEPTAFAEFISGGGNIELYAATSRTLAAHHAAAGATRVVDLGCGDGRAVEPALTPDSTVRAVTLVEASRALLSAAVARLGHSPVSVSAVHATAQEFAAGLANGATWQVAEATFAMHALEPAARLDVFRALPRVTDGLVLVEFDAPDLPHGSDEHLRHLAERYEVGLSEYRADEDHVVADGFLLPVLLGQLDRTRPRQTWEQPAADWCAQLREAGWGEPRVEPVASYWWAPAVAISC